MGHHKAAGFPKELDCLLGALGHWKALGYASQRLTGDREIVRTAVAQDWLAISHAAEELWSRLRG